jgi:hypothetical protein
MHTDVAKPSYLKWSEVPITIDRKDHPDKVPQPRSYPLVVAPMFKSRRIHKVLIVTSLNLCDCKMWDFKKLDLNLSAHEIIKDVFHFSFPSS